MPRQPSEMNKKFGNRSPRVQLTAANWPAAVRPAATTSTWAKPNTPALADTDTAALALGPYQLETAQVDSVPFRLTSEAVGMAASFVSVLVDSWVSNGDEQ